jgi:replicative DNA helicase
MASVNLNQCDKACLGCVKRYKKKHTLRRGGTFDIPCRGIPSEYVSESVSLQLSEAERATASAMLDPVTWARENLDWHCFDPDGEVWRRKNPDEYWEWIDSNPGEDITGHSRYHRPYQADMLRCTSKRKVFRIGRQAGKTETLVISMLYHMFCKPGVAPGEGFKIVVIAPYQAQIDLIFNRLIQLIRTSPITQNSLRRNVKAPIYTLELHNGSVVRGFTAGTKSGGNAEAVRGQHGHMLVFDEADYLSPGDMDAAMSIITNFPNASVWMSSTPSGKRERFFQTCHMKRYKEYHHPSSVNPLWNKGLEEDFREALTEIGYVHEVEADFGEQEQGVFQNVYVQAAKGHYKYGDFPQKSRWTYTVGVDWNDTKNGTTVVVLGFNPSVNKFIIVDRHTISREGWTQLAACQKIAELNRIWRPIAIYLDAGFGGTQWEVLRSYGFNAAADPTRGPRHPDARLRDIIKKYDFGSKVETRDPFTKQPLQKPAKPFLVESTVRRFETGDIVFSDVDDILERQLLGYIIDRITPTGVPVYKASDEALGDHVLDALMLAVMGFTLEVSAFGKPKWDTRILFSGNFGEGQVVIHEGDTVITDDGRKVSKQREGARPSMTRTESFDDTSILGTQQGLPANHTTSPGGGVSTWAWPGFLRDEPRPKPRSITRGAIDRRLSGRPRSSCRPKRKNI